MYFFTLVTFLLLFVQFTVQQNEQPEHTLTREMIDAILQVLSPNCRIEMEQAIDSEKDMSMDCKLEIQSAIPHIISPEDKAAMQKKQEEYNRDIKKQSKGQKRQRSSRNRGDDSLDIGEGAGTSPIVIIGTLVSIVIAFIVGIYLYFSSQRVDNNAVAKKVVKKIQKKKVPLNA